VLGWRHDWFPAFYTRSSGVRVAHRIETADEIAVAHRVRSTGGTLLTVPIPEADQLDQTVLDGVLEEALLHCKSAGITGPAVTPYVLARIGEATQGRSVPANLALAENNARVATEVAVALSGLHVD